MPTVIHPTALVEPGAQLGVDCTIHAYAIVKRWALIGDRVTIHPFAVVGGDSQDLKFEEGSESWATVGRGTTIREYVTISRGTDHGSRTTVGEHCLLMASCHVAHDCTVGDHVIVANSVLLAGHVTVADYAVLGGASIYHQFSQVGTGVMVGGGARVSLDLPPFTLIAERNEVIGLNLPGLRRRGIAPAAIAELKETFQLVYGTPGNIREVAQKLIAEGEFKTPEASCFLRFFVDSKRGVARQRQAAVPELAAETA